MYLPVCLILAGLSFLAGFFCVKNPAGAIKIQQLFYAKINWRIEPISMEKEIRNTRGMGLFLIALALVTLWVLGA